jgi:CheY-like chemotaxis protein
MPNETHFLLVEDDPNDVFMAELAFRQTAPDARLHLVIDGEEAIEYLLGQGRFADRQQHPMPNVILLDLKMPRIGGFEVLEWLRKDAPKNLHMLPVVVMSSSNLPEDVKRAYSLGVNSYLVKPVNWQQFKKNMAALNVYWGQIVETPPVG